MIARTWRGWAPTATADAYQRHYATEVAEHLRNVPGFQGARLLRRADGDDAARLVVLDARVRRLDGSIQDRQLTVTLRRGPDGRWRVAKLSGD